MLAALPTSSICRRAIASAAALPKKNLLSVAAASNAAASVSASPSFVSHRCRTLATVTDTKQPSTPSFNGPLETDGQDATLHLKTGQNFTGKSFGAPESKFGELVFTTSITSYTESMTDPSYRAQILVFTQPMLGNYGVPHNVALTHGQNYGGPEVFLESNRIQCAGVVVADLAERYSHWQAVESISSWCNRNGVPGITGVDTRAITTLLRSQGTTLGKLAVGKDHAATVPQDAYWDPTSENLVDQVSTKTPYTLNPDGDVRIALLDFGSKANIMRSLVKQGARLDVLPWNYDFNSVRDQYDGLFISNGPGDPSHCMEAAISLRKTIDEWNKPIFGICMGNQILGLAAGLETYRMSFGNRGHNQPVLALAEAGSVRKGRVMITSQNHQYAVKLVDPFPKGWEPFFLNCNDSSVEGIKSTDDSGKFIWACQFHPESAGGPLDTMGMFEDFVGVCRALRDAPSKSSPSQLLREIAAARPLTEGEKAARRASFPTGTSAVASA